MKEQKAESSPENVHDVTFEVYSSLNENLSKKMKVTYGTSKETNQGLWSQFLSW